MQTIGVYGPFDILRRAECYAVADIRTSPLVPAAARPAAVALGIIASMGASLIKEGRLVGALCVTTAEPRDWTAEEVTTLREAAERIWSAVERARAETRLRETEARLTAFGEASSDVLWIRNAETLAFEYISPAYERIYGVSCDEAFRGDTLRNWLDRIVPEDRDKAREALERVRQGERHPFEYRITCPATGQVRLVRDTGFPIRDPNGRVLWIAGVGHDATEETASAERPKVLVGELQHHTRNLLRVVRSPAEQALIEQTDNDNLQGAMLMIACMAVFACNDALIKYVTQQLPLSQAIVMRGAFVLPLMLALGLRQGRLRLRVPRRDLLPLVTRSLAEVSSSLLYLLALRQMPLGNISAIMQSLPLAVMLGAAVFFRERMGWRRIGAVLVGFAGVLVVLRPGTGAFDEWAIIALLSVVLIVVRDLVTRKFSGDVGSSTVAFYAAFAVMMSGFVLGFEEPWRWPTQRETLLLLLSASFLTAGYITAVASMRVGEISFVAPFRYTSLLFAIVLGLLVFGEWPDLWTISGATLIIWAGIYAILREGKARKGHI